MLYFLTYNALADVKPAAIFADNMVLQRETKAPVWGLADPGEKVTVIGSWGESASAIADETGKWTTPLQTPEAGGPYTLTIKGKNAIEIQNVLSGEVWFCSGQSNMDFEMLKLAKFKVGRTKPVDQEAAEYVKKEIATARDDQLRQFTVQKNTSPLEPLDALKGSWIVSYPKTNAEFSATAYFFGRELRRELDVPVALIKCAWGGTRIEAWMPAGAFQGDKEMAAYYQTQGKSLEGPNIIGDKAEEAPKKAKPTNKERRHDYPSTLFNAMVNPVIPYAIRGAIWYQGEANSKHNTDKYERNLRALISSWRELWGQRDSPFYFVQLANYAKPKLGSVEYDGWPSVCNQQRRTLGLKNTGMAVLSDIGEADDVHPHNKIDVGKRLALWALKNDYKQDIPVCSGPLYKSHEMKGGKVIITFDSVGSGLMTGEKTGMAEAKETSGPLKHFQICGADRAWKWAEANIVGQDTLEVWHDDIAEPLDVRYAWSSNPEGANLYNKEGLPASLFKIQP
jgi:sialate O-acetylesterase